MSHMPTEKYLNLHHVMLAYINNKVPCSHVFVIRTVLLPCGNL